MKVFVGSTHQDLLTYRAAATRAILMAGDLSEDMLYWPAADSPPVDESLRHLRSSDLMVLLIAHRYGSPPPGLEHSITELEFDEAVRANIPVLAFQVDPDYAWPPRFIDSDQKSRSQLERFISKVKSRVTFSSFTTPESLEVAIAHSVMHHSGRRMSVSIPEYAIKRLQHVSRAESLFYAPDSTVIVGNAPDGAPLLLAVARRIEVSEPMAKIAESVGGKADDQLFSGIISEVSQKARTHAAASGVCSASWDGGAINVYVPHRTITDLMSPTLFQAMLAAGRGNSHGRSVFHTEGTIRSGVDASKVRHEDVASLGGANRYLAVGLDDGNRTWTGGWSNSKPARFLLSRPFIEEGLERLSNVKYVISREKDKRGTGHTNQYATVLDTDTPSRFHDYWVNLLTSTGEEEFGRYTYGIQIPRISILKFLLEVVEEVAGLHSLGRIHGDIKPSNTLVNRNGSTLIDDVDLTIGDVSPTVSVGWSPFEQLLRQPLSCAADVFSLGQMLLHVLGGQSLGREVSYRMPEGKTGIVIEDPAIYMPADGCIGSPVIRQSWCQLIERALKTDPSRRWQNAGLMARELRALIGQGGIGGQVSIKLPFGGGRPSLVHQGNGQIGMGWVMRYDQITRIW